jgi:hypothetical protein
MIIQRCLRYSRPPAAALLSAFVLMVAPLPLLASEEAAQEPRVTNVDWLMDGEQMVVSYDLVGEAATSYTVSFALRRSADPDFRLVPARAFGDIGEGVTAGSGKMIQWRIQDELGQLPEGENFFVELTVEEADVLPWFLVVVGVAVGGATIYSLVQSGAEPGASSIAEHPTPPARP